MSSTHLADKDVCVQTFPGAVLRPFRWPDPGRVDTDREQLL